MSATSEILAQRDAAIAVLSDSETAKTLSAMSRDQLAQAWSAERGAWERLGDYSTRRMLLIITECDRRGIAPWLTPALRRELIAEAANAAHPNKPGE